MKVFYDYAITFDTTVDVTIDGISSINLSENVQVQSPQLDGASAPAMSYVTGYDQGVDFTTTQIGILMALVTSSSDCTVGKSIAATDSLKLFQRLAASGGTRQTGAVNEKYTVNSGMIIPIGISADNNNPATITVMCYPITDGTNLPIVYQGSQSLIGTASPDEQFYAGPAILNGTEIDGIQSTSIQFGIGVKKLPDAGNADCSFAWIDYRNPRITITTTNVELHRTYARGVAISGTTKAFLRAASANGTRKAEDTAEHPAFTVYDGMIVSRGISGSNPKICTLEIIPNDDGSNPLIGYAKEVIAE